MKAVRLLLAVLIASAWASVQDRTYSLVWQPKQGQAFKYVLSMDMSADGNQVLFGSELSVKITSVEKNGDYTVESIYSSPTITVDGKTQAASDDAVNKPEIEKFNAKGERIDAGKDKDEDTDPFGKALGDIMDFNAPEKPVKIGEKWTREMPGNEKSKTRPAKAEYKLAGIDKVGTSETLRVTYTYAETEGGKPVKAEGEFYVDGADGSVVKMNATIDNLRFDDGEGPTSASVKLVRK
jgi:hypothetical protein